MSFQNSEKDVSRGFSPTSRSVIKLSIAQFCEGENRSELVGKHHLTSIFLPKVGQVKLKL